MHSARSSRAIMFEGPDETLRLTENAQPALMAVIGGGDPRAGSRGFDLKDHAAYVAGHSLGEYSALARRAPSRSRDTARLLKIRGQAMQQAVPVGQGAMAAILGLDLDNRADARPMTPRTARSAASPMTMRRARW